MYIYIYVYSYIDMIDVNKFLSATIKLIKLIKISIVRIQLLLLPILC